MHTSTSVRALLIFGLGMAPLTAVAQTSPGGMTPSVGASDGAPPVQASAPIQTPAVQLYPQNAPLMSVAPGVSLAPGAAVLQNRQDTPTVPQNAPGSFLGVLPPALPAPTNMGVPALPNAPAQNPSSGGAHSGPTADPTTGTQDGTAVAPEEEDDAPRTQGALGQMSIGQDQVATEAHTFQEAFKRAVPGYIAPDANDAAWISRAQEQIRQAQTRIDRPQLIVVVDRNPHVQQLRLVLAQPNAAWEVLGGTRVSTGVRGRKNHYITPTGVMAHTADILDYRAQGTYNENHIRGIGIKGMRVWDFGWKKALRGWGPHHINDIRLQMHATDPANLEHRLGHPDSDGCVRIPSAMNVFLDRTGVLDGDIETAAKDDQRYAKLLRPDRTPTPLAGDLLVVIDSSEAQAQ